MRSGYSALFAGAATALAVCCAQPATGSGIDDATFCAFSPANYSATELFASFSFSRVTPAAPGFWAEQSGNATLSAFGALRRDGYVDLLSGGVLNVRDEREARNLTDWTVVLDMQTPSANRLGRDHSATVGTLVPLFHLGNDPHERILAGFTKYAQPGTPVELGRVSRKGGSVGGGGGGAERARVSEERKKGRERELERKKERKEERKKGRKRENKS